MTAEEESSMWRSYTAAEDSRRTIPVAAMAEEETAAAGIESGCRKGFRKRCTLCIRSGT